MEKLIKALKVRLNSAGKTKHKDTEGNDIYVDNDIFSDEQLTVALESAKACFT